MDGVEREREERSQAGVDRELAPDGAADSHEVEARLEVDAASDLDEADREAASVADGAGAEVAVDSVVDEGSDADADSEEAAGSEEGEEVAEVVEADERERGTPSRQMNISYNLAIGAAACAARSRSPASSSIVGGGAS